MYRLCANIDMEQTDNGKPGENRGRKAIGSNFRLLRDMIARLPKFTKTICVPLTWRIPARSFLSDAFPAQIDLLSGPYSKPGGTHHDLSTLTHAARSEVEKLLRVTRAGFWAPSCPSNMKTSMLLRRI